MSDTLHYVTFPSRLGWILLAATDKGIALLDFCGTEAPSDVEALALIRKEYPGCTAEPGPDSPLLRSARDAILRYAEEGEPLSGISLDIRKGTPFQRQVWDALRRIPFGETRSYRDVALEIGRPQSPRAVGQACGRNPVAILVPCHRVLGSGGKPGGYTGGLHIKEALLEIERRGKNTIDRQ